MKGLTIGLFTLQLAALVFASLAFSRNVVAQNQEIPDYVLPRPGARLVSPGTTIAIRSSAVINPGSVNSTLFSVVGAQSGIHQGIVVIADDRKTVIFKPQRPFALGEKVSIRVAQGIRTLSGLVLGTVSFNFTISPQVAPNSPDINLSMSAEQYNATRTLKPALRAANAAQLVTVPADFPTITVTVAANGTGDGYVFISPWVGLNPSYLLIMDDNGEPVYYKKTARLALADFQKQPNGLLTYFDGAQFNALDDTYNTVGTFAAGNGYLADGHDLQLLPDGHALLLIYDSQKLDMSQIVAGGDPNATVIGCIVQELDASKNVVSEWRSWDHFLITDTQVSLTTSTVDYVHCNAVELDNDGNLLLSSRHLSEVTKINRQTGDVIWRLGGKNNQFTFINDASPYFTFQHDIRRLPNGDITLFDDGDLLPASQYSRGVEYQLDEVNKTATLTWQFRNTPDTYAFAMGNTQRLSNGNTVIGWGTAGLVTEVKPDNSKAFELALAPQMTYRAFRFPWHGYPTTPPTLVAQSQGAMATLTYSWNGATDIATYRIYGGSSPHPTTQIATQAKTGFETETVVAYDPAQCTYFRVMPIDNSGGTTQYSSDAPLGDCVTYYFPQIGK